MTDSDVAEILYELEEEGYKITPLRQAVIEIFSRRQHPLLLEELGRLLHDRLLQMHRATLYRELDFLEMRKIVTSVVLGDGKTRYEFADRNHHHHAVCEQCKRIEDIEIDEDTLKLEESVASKNNFKITRHTLEFFGICGNCKTL